MTHARGDIFFGDQADDRVTFAEAFPEIADATAEIHESGEGNHGLGVRRLRKSALREYINCSNDRCGGKGFALGFYLREMIKEGVERRDLECDCESRDENGKPCENRFKAVIHIRYHDSHRRNAK